MLLALTLPNHRQERVWSAFIFQTSSLDSTQTGNKYNYN